MRYKISIIILSFLFSSTLMFGQGSLVNKETNAAYLDGAYLHSSELTGYNFSGGFVFDGTFDFGLSLGALDPEATYFGSTLNATTFAAKFSFFPLKQDNDSIPLSISLHIGYDQTDYSSEVLDRTNTTLSSNIFSFGGTMYRDLKVRGDVKFQPFFRLSNHRATYSDAYPRINSNASETENYFVAGFGMSVMTRISHDALLYATPELTVSKHPNLFSLRAGLIFPLK
ncbi:MAG: hypothetical protein HY960_08555 [Ignavibacteriae bacterium]|nr:hypothetical protein [Ignavibacteriota bacterium]